jgi:hypothetical protein
MGLDIRGIGSKKEYHHDYGGIHIIRALALKSIGKENLTLYNCSIPDYSNMKPEDYDEFPNLINFSDCEGIYIPGAHYNAANIPRNNYVGNSTALLEELEKLKTYFAKTADISERERKLFSEFYDLVEDVVNGGSGIIIFE